MIIKLKKKKCDAIILNDVSKSEIGLNSNDNEVHFITKNKKKSMGWHMSLQKILVKIKTPKNNQISEMISLMGIPVTALITKSKIPYGSLITNLDGIS